MEIDVITNFSKDVVQYNNLPIRLYYTDDEIYVVVSDLANCVLKQRVDGGFTNYKTLKDTKHIYVFDKQRIRVVPEKAAFLMVESCSKFSKLRYRDGWSKLLSFMKDGWGVGKKEVAVRQINDDKYHEVLRISGKDWGFVPYGGTRIKYALIDRERYFSIYHIYKAAGYRCRPADKLLSCYKVRYVRKEGVDAVNPLMVMAEKDVIDYIEHKAIQSPLRRIDEWKELFSFASNGWKIEKKAKKRELEVEPEKLISKTTSSSFVSKAAEEFASVYQALVMAFGADEARKIAAKTVHQRHGVNFAL